MIPVTMIREMVAKLIVVKMLLSMEDSLTPILRKAVKITTMARAKKSGYSERKDTFKDIIERDVCSIVWFVRKSR